MARDPDGELRFKQIRTFQMGSAPIVEISAEERRKGFVALDAAGKMLDDGTIAQAMRARRPA